MSAPCSPANGHESGPAGPDGAGSAQPSADRDGALAARPGQKGSEEDQRERQDKDIHADGGSDSGQPAISAQETRSRETAHGQARLIHQST